MQNLNDILSFSRDSLDATYQARETALAHGRGLTRTCANAIRSMHRGEFAEARAALDSARAEAEKVTAALEAHPDLFFAGYVQDAHKERAEAECLMALLQGNPLPTPEELKIAVASYLNGLAEAASEGRRYALDCLRREDLAGAERTLAAMDEILSGLTTLDYPDAVTSGLRRTCDALRAVVERTRGDVTLATLHHNLIKTLKPS
ncbi:MAG: haloacid dehalogenase [Armatimonadaceae bacterium]